MKFKYIAIEREYGSGGTKIARQLAKECGINCFGQEILEAVSQKYSVSVNDLQRYEEAVSGSFMFTIYAMGQMQSGNSNVLPEDSRLLVAEHEFIQRSALDGAAVYLGHCAAEALKAYNVLKVFIHCSDKDKKSERIVSNYGIAQADVERTRKRFDNKRAKYYFANTAKKWDDFRNYDIVLDTAVLGIDGCVSVLKCLIG